VCTYAYIVKAGPLVSSARKSSGLPVRRLAKDADVAGSTITRIQSGVVDPTLNTLERILNAAGFELRIEAVRPDIDRPARLADLADAWTYRSGTVRVDWTRWRHFLDTLALHPELIPDAIFAEPPPAGDPVIDALLAAVAEKLADDAGLPRPRWTALAPTLDQPYRPPRGRSLPGLAVPPQLAARGLMIDTESLWRNRDTVGV